MAEFEPRKLIAERIRNWRLQSGKSLESVERATGLALDVLRGFEDGSRPVPLGVLRVLAELYQVPAEEVAGFTTDIQLPRAKSKAQNR